MPAKKNSTFVFRQKLPLYATLALVAAFFSYFLFFPLSYVVRRAFIGETGFTLAYFTGLATDPYFSQGLRNSLLIAICVTATSGAAGLFVAICAQRIDFPGRKHTASLMLLPMVMPPFVGAIGLTTLFSRFGAVNQALMALGIISKTAPPDWMGNPFWGVVALETLHLFPIMYLNIAGSLSLVDPALEEAARGLSSSGPGLLRSITLPLIAPGLFAGASIVFIWSFTDLGTPLIFNFRKIATVQIFDMVKAPEANPAGYALVVIVLLVTAIVFALSKTLFGRKRYEMPAFGRTSSAARKSKLPVRILTAAAVWTIFLAAVTPHISVIILSLSKGWSMTILPDRWTTQAYSEIFKHPLTASSINNSLFYSACATIFVLLAGGAVAFILARKKMPGKEILDACAMLPLAVPGIVLAYGYVTSFTGTWLDPFSNPVILLIASYAIRRLPLVVRALYSGLLQAGVSLEEAGASLGASAAATFRLVTLPLIRPHILGAAILAFVFSMLEVSDSLILAMQEEFYPMTKAIYSLIGRIGDGMIIASAMGVLGIAILAAGLFAAQKLLGKSLGSMFRT